MALSLGNGPSQGTNPASVGFASGANAVTLLYVTYYSAGPNFTTTSSITDPGGRTWRCRKRTTLQSLYAGAGSTAGAQYITQEVWWATDTVAHNVIMTLNLANSAGLVQTQWVMQDVNGSLTPSAPWDTHASEPAVTTASSASGLTAPSVSFTTAQANSLILACLSEETDAAASTLAGAGTGYTAVISNTPNGTSPDQFHMLLESKATTTAGAQTATTTTTKPAFIFSADALSGTSTGTAASGNTLAIAGTPVQTNGLVGASVSSPSYSVPSNSIVVAVVTTYGFTGLGFCPVSGVTDTGGLTWHRRRQTKFQTPYAGAGATAGAVNITQEIWWAYAGSAQTSNVVTAAISNSGAESLGSEIQVFGVSGVQNTSAPWDDNASLPAAQTFGSNAGATQAINPTGTTSQDGSMVLGFLQNYTSTAQSTPPTVGAGFTSVIANVRGSSPNQICVGVEQKLQATAGATAAPWVNSEQSYIAVVDALSGTMNGSSADGSPPPAGSATGTITTSLTKVSQNLSASEKITGTAATHLTKVSQLLTQATSISGTVTTRLSRVNFQLMEQEIFTGTITMHLNPAASFGVAVSAAEVFTGQIVTRLGPVNMASVGEEDFIAHVVTRLGSADGHIAANVVQAEVIVLGPIEMTLPPFRPLILGAKLGTPGTGKWYSWRYSDS